MKPLLTIALCLFACSHLRDLIRPAVTALAVTLAFSTYARAESKCSFALELLDHEAKADMTLVEGSAREDALGARPLMSWSQAADRARQLADDVRAARSACLRELGAR